MERIILRNVDRENSHRIDVYLRYGGYKAFEKVLKEMTPQDVVEDVKRSGFSYAVKRLHL